jgi:hypothetical protein
MMNKNLLFTLVAATTIGQANAQVIKDSDLIKPALKDYATADTSFWTYGGVLNIGGNQGFLHNWAAGGELASFTVNGIFNGFVNNVNGRNIWANNLDLNYGLNYTYSNSFIPRKTDDRIDFTSKYGHQMAKDSKWFVTGLFNFKSQFTKGYDYSLPDWQNNPTSNFFSPAYFTLAPGIEYREGDRISVFYSPVAARLTVMDKLYTLANEKGAFGVDYGKTTRFELGSYLSLRYITDPTKKITFRTRLDVYANYLAKDIKNNNGEVVRKDNPGNLYLLSDNLITFKFNKHLGVSVGLVFIYDNAVPYSKTFVNEQGVVTAKNEPLEGLGWLQVRQNLQFGLEYKLPLRNNK